MSGVSEEYMAPTLFTACNTLPPEGAALAQGGPSGGTALIDLGARRFHHLRPFHVLGIDECRELLWRVAPWNGALGQKFFLDGRVVERFGHFLLDA